MDKRVLIALGPFDVEPEEEHAIDFRLSSRPKLIKLELPRIRPIACSIQGEWHVRSCQIGDSGETVSGSPRASDFCALFSKMSWPSLGDRDRIRMVVYNPELYEQAFSVTFLVSKVETERHPFSRPRL